MPDALALQVAAAENESSKINHKSAKDRHNDKVDECKENQFKAHAFLWEKCSPQMKRDIESQTDCKTRIENNPIESLQIIKVLSMNHQATKCPCETVHDALKTFVNVKQTLDEDITQCLDRFKAAAKNLTTQLGGDLDIPSISTQATTHQSDPDGAMKEVFAKFKAHTFMANSDQMKCGSSMTDPANVQKVDCEPLPPMVGNSQNEKPTVSFHLIASPTTCSAQKPMILCTFL